MSGDGRAGWLRVLWQGPPRKGPIDRWAWQAAISAAFFAAAISTVITLVLAVNAYRIPFPQLWAASCGLLLTMWSLRLVVPPPAEPEAAPAAVMAGVATEPFAGAAWWQQRLGTTSGDIEWFDRVVRRRLVVLVSERLRQRHGLPLTADPERVKAIVSPPLYDFLTVPLPRTPTPYELDLLITRIEEI